MSQLGQVRVASGATTGWFSLCRIHRAKLELLPALLVYFGFACYFTWPLITDLSHIFYGGLGDPYGTMAFYRELVVHHHNPFLPGTIPQLSAPEGQPIPWTRDLASMPGILTQYLFTAAFGSTPAFGLYALMGYTLTGIATFLLVRHLTGRSWIGLISGWAFAFYPYAIINGAGHNDNVQGWVLVLGVWRMLELARVPSRRNAVLAGAAVVFGMWWSPYFILLGGTVYLAMALGTLALAWRQARLGEAVRVQLVTAAVVVIFLGFLGLLTTGPKGNSIGVRENGVPEFNAYAARPLEYVLPDSRSPLFGRYTRHYLLTHLHGSNEAESTLYVGVSIILLAFVAFVGSVRRRLSPELRYAALLLSLVTLAALITSAPPEARIFGVLIPFPSHLIAKVTTTWRVYARFVIVVMLALSVLAGIGLYFLTAGRRPSAQVLILIGATVLIPLDLWGRDDVTNKIEVPQVYTVLSRQPEGLVANYPLTPVGENTYNEMFFRSSFNKPMINGYLEGTFEEKRALALAQLSDPRTAHRLAALGVRYVILESTAPAYGLAPPGMPRRGFRLIYREPYAQLYEVTASPSGPALPAANKGFGTDEAAVSGTFNWLEESSGTIELAGACELCRGVLRMTMSSFARPRTVEVSAEGHVLARFRVIAPRRVTLPLVFRKHLEVRVTANPGPQSIKKTTGSPDPRSVSVQVGDLEFI